MRDFSKIEQDIATVLRMLTGKLSDKASSWVRENSEQHGEQGLALEDLIWSIDDEKVSVPSEAFLILKELAAMMPIEAKAKAILSRLDSDNGATKGRF